MTTTSLVALVGFSILFFLLAWLTESVSDSSYYYVFNKLNVLRNFALIWLVVALVGGKTTVQKSESITTENQ